MRAWIEIEVRSNREQFTRHHGVGIETRAREILPEDLMETMPAENMVDTDARFAWVSWLQGRDLFRYHDEAFLNRIQEDLILMVAEREACAQIVEQMRFRDRDRLAEGCRRRCAAWKVSSDVGGQGTVMIAETHLLHKDIVAELGDVSPCLLSLQFSSPTLILNA